MSAEGPWHHARVAYSRARMQAAADHIVHADPAFASIVAESPLCTIGKGSRNQLTPFHSLVGSVIAQQLSVKAADTITSRVEENLGGEVTPQRIVQIDESDLRGAGLSGAKTRTIKGLAHAVHDGVLDLERTLTHPEDSAIVAELTKLWGIGRWTAEMFLIFYLMRPDVLPLDDLGLLKGISVAYFSGEPVSRAEAREVADAWTPYRSVATWYIWRSLDPLPVEY